MLLRTISLSLLLANVGCATSFTGNAHVKGGRAQCEATCKSSQMELGGMVFLGEYSSGCVCLVPGQTTDKATVVGGAEAAATGAVGVVMQMRRTEEQRGVIR